MNSESSTGPCPKCGAAIPPDAPRGLCPRCMIAGVATPSEPGIHGNHRIQPPPLATVAAAFPDLEILELVGVGGMGVVYKARQPRFDRLVALKLLPESLSADPAFAERFDREARFLARLTHPNIVAVHDFGRAGGFCYLLMEFVDGMNLRQAMRAGRFTPDEALALVPRVCEALQYAHERGILHRDIKPENILLDAEGRVKIADFGIAKLLGNDPADITLTVSGARLGTPHYMAPEQIEKPSQVDHRADIYSLGVVFYELLTGELPLGRFSAPSVKALIDGRVDEIVMRALAKERELRQQTAGEVRSQVEGLGAAAAESARATGRRNGCWAGFRVVDGTGGRPTPRWPGIGAAVASGLPAIYLLWAIVLITVSSSLVPMRLSLAIVATVWITVAGWGCHRAWKRFDATGPASVPLPELPKWARNVATALAVVAGLGLLRFLWERFAPPAIEFRQFTFSLEPTLLVFSVALWTRHRGWRKAATIGAATFALLMSLGGLGALLNPQKFQIGAPRVEVLETVVGMLSLMLFPIGLATLWHPVVMKAFDDADPRPVAPEGPARWKTAFGWGSVGLGTVFALWAVIYLLVTPVQYQAVVRFQPRPEVGARLVAQNLMGVAIDGEIATTRQIPGTDLWELVAWAGDRHDAAEEANAAFERLATGVGGGLTMVDRPVPPLRPVRPNRPAAIAALGGGLLLLVLPGWLLLRSRRPVPAGQDAVEAARRWRQRRLVEASCVFVALMSASAIVRIIRDRNQPTVGTVHLDPTNSPSLPPQRLNRREMAHYGLRPKPDRAGLWLKPKPGQTLWLTLTVWSNGVAIPVRGMTEEIHPPAENNWNPSNVVAISWTLAGGPARGHMTLSALKEPATGVTFPLPLPPDQWGNSRILGEDAAIVDIGFGAKSRRWLFTDPDDDALPADADRQWGISVDVESEPIPTTAAIQPLRHAFTHLSGGRFTEALADVDECLAAVKAAPVERLAWRSEDSARVFPKPVVPRLLALKAVLAALADDAAQLRAALDAGESVWGTAGPVDLFQVWVRHYQTDAPEITDELSIDAKELRALRAGEAPEVTVRRRPKAYGQPEETFHFRDQWWLTK